MRGWNLLLRKLSETLKSCLLTLHGNAKERSSHLFEKGGELERLGRLDEALQAYKEVIQLTPSFAEAHFRLGNLLLDSNRATEALNAYSIAIKFRPDSAGAHYNLALSNLKLGNLNEALSACRSAITFKPDFVDAHLTAGSTLLDLNRSDEAVKLFDAVLSLLPDCTLALQNKGVALQKLGKHRDAAESYLSALSIDPKLAECHVNLAGAYRELGLLSDALKHYEIAVELAPDSADIRYNYGIALNSNGDVLEAIDCFRRTIHLQHNHVEAHIDLGNLLEGQRQFEEALKFLRKAVELQPKNFGAQLNLGITFLATGNIAKATDCFRRAVSLNPNSPEANLCLGSAFKDSGDMEVAIKYIERSLELSPTYLLAYSVWLFSQNYLSNISTQRAFEKARQFDNVVNGLAMPFSIWRNSQIQDRKLRIGFVSGDFCDHPVGYFIESIFSTIFTSQACGLEVVAYVTRENCDATSNRIRACCYEWRPVGNLSDELFARVIHEDGIDILIDLAGHSAHNRLSVFAWRAAPVQVTWLGYFATTGLTSIDYLIADPWTLPVDQEKYFTEKVWRLPDTRLCFTEPNVDICVNPLPAMANGYITFGSFNNLSKISETVIKLWASLLLRLPSSRLLLKANQLSDVALRQETFKRFEAYGILAHRLILEGHQSRAEYFSAYHKVDIALDPFPYPGGTTTVESLWMGVPVLTLAGEKFLSRQGVGLLMNAGLSDWIAKDKEEYLSLAIAHTQDLEYLEQLRAKLRNQVTNSPLFDAKSFVSHLEAAFRSMWTIWSKR